MAEKVKETNIILDSISTESVAAISDKFIGTVFDGRYKIESKLGYGGMAVVYKATHLFMERLVAIKLLHSENVADVGYIERFKQEARAAGRIQHPNAVGISDFGVTNDNIFYLVMEYLEGYSLRTRLQKEEPLPLKEVTSIITQICNAVEFAHKNNVIHRDLKPDNVFVHIKDDVETIKVLDFGIAKILQSSTYNTRLTATGAIIGTPQYMSPEQCQGDTVDHLTDIYSLGIIAYELLTGTLPFNSENPLSIALKQLNEPPPNPCLLRPDLSEAVDTVIKQALAKNRKQRIQSASTFASELSQALNCANKIAPVIITGNLSNNNEIKYKEKLPTINLITTDKICSNPDCKTPKPDFAGYCGSCKCLLVGKIMRDRYEIEQLISKSSSNFTYLVKDRDCFEQILVLKEIRHKVPKNEESHNLYQQIKTTFETSARSLLRFNHKGLPKFYAYFMEGNNSYLVQDYILGNTLAQEVKASGPLNSETCFNLLLELADILDYLHNQDPSIVHCGIKPQNLIITSKGLILVDFSDFCKALSDKSKSSQLTNSRGYVAPEQIFGRSVPQSDLFSAGATIIYLLSGFHPNLLYDDNSQVEFHTTIEVSRDFLNVLKELLIQNFNQRLATAKLLKEKLESLKLSENTSGTTTLTINKLFQIFKDPISLLQDELQENIKKTINLEPNLEPLTKAQSIENNTTSLTDSQVVFTKPPDESGDMSQIHIAFLLTRFLSDNRSGLLTCINEFGVRTIYFEKGTVAFANSTSATDRLGEILVRIGRITASEYEQALTIVNFKKIFFDKALIEIGIVKPEQIKSLITIQISHIIYSLFEWTKGKYEIRYDLQLNEPTILSLSIPKILFDGLYYLSNFDMVKNWLGDFTRKFALTVDPILLRELKNLGKNETLIISKITSTTSVKELLELNFLPELEIISSIYGLFALGILSWSNNIGKQASYISENSVEEKNYDSIESAKFDLQTVALFCHEVENQLQITEKLNYYGILGLERNAKEQDIEVAYKNLAEKFHPDKHIKLLGFNQNLRLDLEKLFSRILQAYNSLGNVLSRNEYDTKLKNDSRNINRNPINSLESNIKVNTPKLAPLLEKSFNSSNSSNSSNSLTQKNTYDLSLRKISTILPLPAETWFRKGVDYYETKQFEKASRAFRAAIVNDSYEPKYYLFLARSLALQGYVKEAEMVFLRVIDLVPKNIDYQIELGLFYKKNNLLEKAKITFEKTLKYSSNNFIVNALS
ncbi:MAG: protein kinase [Acidobacteria bacterium]|nr:protein kinase [Acidobacteriota bacterium]